MSYCIFSSTCSLLCCFQCLLFHYILIFCCFSDLYLHFIPLCCFIYYVLSWQYVLFQLFSAWGQHFSSQCLSSISYSYLVSFFFLVVLLHRLCSGSICITTNLWMSLVLPRPAIGGRFMEETGHAVFLTGILFGSEWSSFGHGACLPACVRKHEQAQFELSSPFNEYWKL